MTLFDLDTRVRLCVMERFVETGSPPTAREVAETLDVSEAEAAHTFRRLEQGHVLVLAPATDEIWMANPLSATPTPFRVVTERGSFWGNCIWDGLGVVAMLGSDGVVTTACADCGEPMELTVRDGSLEPVEGVAHFAVPAARWWRNIAFT